MLKTYRITKRNQVKPLFYAVSYVFLNCAIILAILIFAVIKTPLSKESIHDLVNALSPFLLFCSVLSLTPTLILHVRYYALNRNLKLQFSKEQSSFVIEDSKKKTSLLLSEISELEHIKTISYPGFPWEKYSLLRIQANNKEFYLTCFLDDFKNIPLQPTRVTQKLFPWPSFPITEKIKSSSVMAERFKKKYSKLSSQEIKNKVINQGLVSEAEQAGIEILEERGET